MSSKVSVDLAEILYKMCTVLGYRKKKSEIKNELHDCRRTNLFLHHH